MENKDAVATFNKLNWDTEFFGVRSAKAIIYRPLKIIDWKCLKNKFKEFQFVSIVNQNSEPINAQLIGKETSAYLADVNIQFAKKLKRSTVYPNNITIHKSLERNNQILEIADFQFSKFTEDPELAKRGGDQVYRQWISNAFDNPDKFYALSQNTNGVINGFALYSYSDSYCVIELIAASQRETKGGIGTNLFMAIENDAYQHGYREIKVGTQIRNIAAINFYNKVGCKQIGCHQVYHLWNLEEGI